MAHFPHWMQIFESQVGISSAKLRFSHFAVPVGKVPSTGNALTGNSFAAARVDHAQHVSLEFRC
jgi:hypothetical protein